MVSRSTHCWTTGRRRAVDIQDFRAQLGGAIRIRRRAAALTQEQLAEQTGSSTEWISQIERGLGMPSLELLVSISGAIRCGPEDLVRAASDEAHGREGVQELLLVAERLDDGELRVLLATASAMHREQEAASARSEPTGPA